MSLTKILRRAVSDSQSKRLRMFAGPNGSGKSSIIRRFAIERNSAGLFRLNHYLNADDVEQSLRSDGLDLSRFNIIISLDEIKEFVANGKRLPPGHLFFEDAKLEGSRLIATKGAADGYAAAAVIDYIRAILLGRGDSFSFETVMSHSAKIEFFREARLAGYKTYLYFVSTRSVELNIARVESRFALGGHSVPVDKIRSRYTRSIELAPLALKEAYRAYFFDNSGDSPTFLAEFDRTMACRLWCPTLALPEWFREYVLPVASSLFESDYAVEEH